MKLVPDGLAVFSRRDAGKRGGTGGSLTTVLQSDLRRSKSGHFFRSCIFLDEAQKIRG